jgi:hypothetical protein
LVLTGAQFTNATFSFVFLVVSEIIPAFLMVTVFTAQSGLMFVYEKMTGKTSDINKLTVASSTTSGTSSSGSSSSASSYSSGSSSASMSSST